MDVVILISITFTKAKKKFKLNCGITFIITFLQARCYNQEHIGYLTAYQNRIVWFIKTNHMAIFPSRFQCYLRQSI